MIEEEIPETEHDFNADLITTSDEVIPCPNRPAPARTGLGRPHRREDQGEPGARREAAIACPSVSTDSRSASMTCWTTAWTVGVSPRSIVSDLRQNRRAWPPSDVPGRQASPRDDILHHRVVSEGVEHQDELIGEWQSISAGASVVLQVVSSE